MNLFDEFKLAFEFQSEHHYTVIKLKLKIILKRKLTKKYLIEKYLESMKNFITKSDAENLKKRLIELIEKSEELKFLVGFFYFSG